MRLIALFSLSLALLAGPLHAQTLLKDVEDLLPGMDSSPHNWAAVSETHFVFEANNLLQTQYLFASDGTEAGTIGLGAYQVDTDIIRLGNKVYFGGCNIFLSPDSCGSLYVSDGTVAGTGFFFDLVPGGISLGITDIVAGDSLFFFAGHTPTEGVELWRSNGTAAGTYRVADIAPGPEDGYRGELTVINDIAFFAGYTPDHGIEPWYSDGSPANGTFMIEDLNDGTPSSHPADFTASGGYIYFGALGTNSGFEVRRTDSTGRPTDLIGNFGTTASSRPRDFVDSDGTLYYVSDGVGTAGFELYVYQHTGDPVAIDFPTGDIFPRALMPFGDGKVVFNAELDHGRELWISDGTLAGTQMIIDLYPGPKDGVFGTGLPGESFYVWNDSLVYFAGADSVHAEDEFVYELFVTDGTAAGTQLVSDMVPGPEGANPGDFFEFGGRLYFAATDLAVGREPFYLGLPSTTAITPPALSFTQLPYPNPVAAGSAVRIGLSLQRSSAIQAQLYDVQGREVQTRRQHLPAGAHLLEIPLAQHLRGLYYLRIQDENGQHVDQLIRVE